MEQEGICVVLRVVCIKSFDLKTQRGQWDPFAGVKYV